ncbi:MAG: hypothetical protein F6K23_07425 [Okeania sp. SIO2C9]|uniref:hypothetical protein n=1 Tax=Okeania sp. SIO2C9 TaxID=2607791 RepID=UPI0013C041AA|nr:hypothetical protein [Okeania sp. SIO2C9]NEQ72917.1 hypothetical protein [Okeania sp. SIO2C9]
MNKILKNCFALGVSLSVLLSMSEAQAFSLINDDQIVPTSDLTENFNDFFLE